MVSYFAKKQSIEVSNLSQRNPNWIPSCESAVIKTNEQQQQQQQRSICSKHLKHICIENYKKTITYEILKEVKDMF